jgi:peptidoglycan/LPS O-acetylase OafA/YrhL
MSAVTQSSRESTGGASTQPRTRHRAALIVSFVALGWSIIELLNLARVHTTGPELYGVLVAALSVGAGVLSVLLLRSDQRRLRYTLPVVALWAVVALGGIAGIVAHMVGPVAGHGPVDLRPRPFGAPLIFTLLGLVGSAALWFGQRPGTVQAKNVERSN